jgi:predicted ATPase
VDHVPEQIESAILKRSEGNPFYLQEMIKTLLDKNIITINQREVKILERDFESILPGTIQGIIMARIDNIQESIKSVLFSAAVIGREFSRPLLEKVVDVNTDLDSNLDELQSLELILEKEEAQEFDYIFKHYLIQEVAYNTILLNKRKELHAGIANAIESLYVDRLHEFYEVLAFHFEKAEMWEKAAEYLGRSGNKAKQIYTKDESGAASEVYGERSRLSPRHSSQC